MTVRKEHYTDYVKHALRYYIRTTQKNPSEKPHFRTNADRANGNASEAAMNDYDSFEQRMFYALYGGKDALPYAVNQYAMRFSMDADRIWRMITDLERNVARRRGLI